MVETVLADGQRPEAEEPGPRSGLRHKKLARIVQLTDWLPPEFSAVSQYALLIAEQEARAGAEVTVIGLSSQTARQEEHAVGPGSLRVVAVRRRRYEKASWLKRLLWSLRTNALLIRQSWTFLRRADTIRFTGSPPFLLHFVSAANLLLRKRTVYRITDFYPECIIAAMTRRSVVLELFRRTTNMLRRKVDSFEVIGNDMRTRLLDCGISPERIELRRDNSPVTIGPDTLPLVRDPYFQSKKVLLYSGNWGVAHDTETFFEGYRRHHEAGEGSVVLWLNATGSGADEMDRRLRTAGLPFRRQELVPLSELARLLVTPDAHLVTLREAFVGYVLPSKIYGCIASDRPIIYVGPKTSDVHELCTLSGGSAYRRVELGDVEAMENVLTALGRGELPAQGSVAVENEAG